MIERPPYVETRVGHCCGCHEPELKVLHRTGPADVFRYRCAACVAKEQ